MQLNVKIAGISGRCGSSQGRSRGAPTQPPLIPCAGDGNVNGFGLEFFIETPADEIGSSLSEIKRSWQFQLLYTVSQLAAGHGGIRSIIDDMHLLSTEAEGVNTYIPEEQRKAHVNRDGRVGALLGLTDTRLGAAHCECIFARVIVCTFC